MNRPEGAGGGGIATMVANSIKRHATKVAENNEHEEYMIIRLEHVKPALNVIHVYGRIESRINSEKVLEGWTELLQELISIENRQEAALLIGDLNRGIGCGVEGVEGNRREISYGGSLIRDLVSSGEYFLLNNLNLTMGGPWTRVYPGDGRPSCLDLAIGSANLKPHVRKMTIDKDRVFTPRRAVTKAQGGLGVTYSDHFATMVELEMPKANEVMEKPKSTWNTQKPGGWEAYKEISNKAAKEIAMIAEDEGIDVEKVMSKIDRIQTKVKFAAFGKTKPQTERTKNKVEATTKATDSEDAKELLARQASRIEEHIQKVKKSNDGRVTKIFQMKDIVAGKKKVAQNAQAIKDPDTNELIVSNSEIKKVTLKYGLKTLENNKPEEKVKELIELKEEQHRLRMEEKGNDEEHHITDEDFFDVLKKFDSKKSATYEFITKSGRQFQLAILKLCQRLIKNEVFPNRFNLTTLHWCNSQRREMHNSWKINVSST